MAVRNLRLNFMGNHVVVVVDTVVLMLKKRD